MSGLHNLEAEMSVIGAALYDAGVCTDAFERLRPESFFDPVHARIWVAILARVHSGRPPDAISLRDDMGADPGFAEIGGLGYLVDLVDKCRTWALASHVEAVLEQAARRAIHRLAADVAAMALDARSGSAEAIIGEMERGAALIAREGVSRPLAAPAGLTALETLEAAWRGEFVGVSVGLDTLDHVTGGIRRDDVWCIGGRTSMGKSVLGLGLARGIAQQERGVLMFSLEMPLREVQARLVADLAYDPDAKYDAGFGPGNVTYGDLLKGRVHPALRDKAREAAKRLAAMPIVVTDAGGLTIDDIRSQALRQVRSWEKSGITPGAVLVDHIGLVRPVQRSGNKAADTADIVNELKAIAKQIGAPLIVLAQVNRGPEVREDKRPTISDLNWSGAIEQIADLICLIYREGYYLERSGKDGDFERAAAVQHDLELLIHKNRSGPTCNLKVFADVASNVVRDWPDRERQAT